MVTRAGLQAAQGSWLCTVSGHRLRTEGLLLGVRVRAAAAVAAHRRAAVLCGQRRMSLVATQASVPRRGQAAQLCGRKARALL